MGILSASTGLTRYRASGDGAPPDAYGRLKRFAFKDIDQGVEERSFGWVCFDDLLDAEWKGSGPEKGPYLAFSLRLDTRRISPAVFKKHWLQALRQKHMEQAEAGRKYFSRDEKIELREQVRLALLARSLPIPAVFDAVWSTRDNRVYLASTNPKVCMLFQDLFARTFELQLDPLSPVNLALDLLGESARYRIEEYHGADFVPRGEVAP